MGKPKILCLHGGGSNSEVTQFQTAGLKLSSRADCRYLNAPHRAKQCYPGLDRFVEGPFYTWSEGNDNDDDDDHAEQWDKSLEVLADYCRKEGPFDMVFGFSQGAAVVTQFSYPVIWRERFGFRSCPWKSAILACGGATRKVQMMDDPTEKITIPSLHIMGSVDPYLEESRALERCWSLANAGSYQHQKGHEIDLMILMREVELDAILNEFLIKNLP